MSARSTQQTKYEKFVWAKRAIVAGQMTVDEAVAKGLLNEEQAQNLKEGGYK